MITMADEFIELKELLLELELALPETIFEEGLMVVPLVGDCC